MYINSYTKNFTKSQTLLNKSLKENIYIRNTQFLRKQVAFNQNEKTHGNNEEIITAENTESSREEEETACSTKLRETDVSNNCEQTTHYRSK